ncbi:hypothetical protein [Salinigranum marinum]|uniref:hypothetical protein n=1 Tax=Salinigranum marinum TaxID=1515595 RepID=UPI002989C908|nr:hypothetical protein [Salinigranum marinum]
MTDATAVNGARQLVRVGTSGPAVLADVPRFEYVPSDTEVRTTETVIEAGEVIRDA